MKITQSLISLAVGLSFVNSAVVFSSGNSRFFEPLMRRVVRNGVPEQVTYDTEIWEFYNKRVDICSPLLCIRANLTNGAISGFEQIELLKSELDIAGSKISLDIDVKFNSIKLNSDYYEMEGNIMNALPLSGKGAMLVEVQDFEVWGKIHMNQSEKGLFIKKIEDAGFHFDKILCNIEFDGNIDGIFNAIVEDLLAEYLNRFNKAIVKLYSQEIIEKLNFLINSINRTIALKK